jgi:hypothetical protein
MKKANINSLRTIRRRQSKRKKEFIEAFAKSLALVASTCRKVGITPPTFYNWYNDDPVFAAKVDEIRELAKDSVEAKIYKKIDEGDTTMLIFYAKTKMKDRGYVERQEFTGKDGKDLMAQQEVDLSTLTDEQREALLSIGMNLLNKNE